VSECGKVAQPVTIRRQQRERTMKRGSHFAAITWIGVLAYLLTESKALAAVAIFGYIGLLVWGSPTSVQYPAGSERRVAR
jgi:hypothetical protein